MLNTFYLLRNNIDRVLLATPDTRRARSEVAMKQISRLQIRRTPTGGAGPTGQQAPSGQMAQRRIPRTGGPPAEGGTAPPRMAKFAGRPRTPPTAGAPGGQMARAPSTLKITRSTDGPAGIRGPNLGARRAGPPKGGPRGPGGGRENRPQRRPREKKEAGDGAKQSTSIDDVDMGKALSDGMIHHLLRLQRKEWDRVPYEPTYKYGSLAAQQLIHEGKELFRGESPPVKIWSRLEERIGLVGMHNAEAHLKVRRVPDGDDAPFGMEDVQEIKEQPKKPVT